MNKELILPLTFIIITTILTAVDAISDFNHGSGIQHIFIETLVILSGAIGSMMIIRQMISRYEGEIKQSARNLAELKLQAEKWRNKAQYVLEGLAIQIDQQFSEWKFSSAEKDVALFLIKGFSQKEIAALREVQEKTIRQQSTSIYRKSNLSGRAELAAFFLEDLLLPQPKKEAAE